MLSDVKHFESVAREIESHRYNPFLMRRFSRSKQFSRWFGLFSQEPHPRVRFWFGEMQPSGIRRVCSVARSKSISITRLFSSSQIIFPGIGSPWSKPRFGSPARNPQLAEPVDSDRDPAGLQGSFRRNPWTSDGQSQQNRQKRMGSEVVGCQVALAQITLGLERDVNTRALRASSPLQTRLAYLFL